MLYPNYEYSQALIHYKKYPFDSNTNGRCHQVSCKASNRCSDWRMMRGLNLWKVKALIEGSPNTQQHGSCDSLQSRLMLIDIPPLVAIVGTVETDKIYLRFLLFSFGIAPAAGATIASMVIVVFSRNLVIDCTWKNGHSLDVRHATHWTLHSWKGVGFSVCTESHNHEVCCCTTCVSWASKLFQFTRPFKPPCSRESFRDLAYFQRSFVAYCWSSEQLSAVHVLVVHSEIA